MHFEAREPELYSPCLSVTGGGLSWGRNGFSQRVVLWRRSSWVPFVVMLNATGGWMCPLSAGDVGRLAAASTAVRNVFLFSPYLKNLKKYKSVPLLLFKELE